MRTILLSGLHAGTATETIGLVIRGLAPPSAVLVARGEQPSGLASASLRFDTREEAERALEHISKRCPEGVSARFLLPMEGDVEQEPVP